MSAHKTIGVIGLGSIGMRHAKNLLAMGCQVYGFDNAHEAALHDGIYFCDNLAWLKSDIADCDGFVVASPTKHHLPQWANITKPVLIEKPIARALNDEVAVAREELEARDGEITMVGNNLRFHSCVKAAKEELDMKAIGKPLWASFTISQKNTKYTDPCILNWGAHEIDLALHLLGPATVTSAVGNDQWMDVCLLHEYGVPSTIHVDYLAPIERRGFCILGEQANISADLVQRKFILIGRNVDLVQPLGGSFDQDYKDEMQAFIDMIDGKRVPHAATGQDGLHALELILEAQRIANK